MRALTTMLVVLALLSPAVATYMDGDGGGAQWGIFNVCLPNGCGWWLCWPGEPCHPI